MQTPPESDFFYLSSAPHAWDVYGEIALKIPRVTIEGFLSTLRDFFSRVRYACVRYVRVDFN